MSDCSDNDDASYEYCSEENEEYSYKEEEEEEENYLDDFVRDSSSGKFVKKELADDDVDISANNEEIAELVAARLDARSIVDSYQSRFVTREEDDSWSRVSDHDALSFVQSMISQPKEKKEEETAFDGCGEGCKHRVDDHPHGGFIQESSDSNEPPVRVLSDGAVAVVVSSSHPLANNTKVNEHSTKEIIGGLPAIYSSSAPAEIVESEKAGDDCSAVTMAHDWDDASIATAMTNQQGFEDESWDLMSRMSALESSQQSAMQMLDFSSIMSHQSGVMPPLSVNSDYSSVAISTWSMVDGKVPCKRCTFLNEPGTQLCTVCDFALDANPSLTIDEQLALQMQRREDQASSGGLSHTPGLCMNPLEGAQDITDKLFQFIKMHNLDVHVFAKQLDLQFLISSSWLRWREDLLRALETTPVASTQMLKTRQVENAAPVQEAGGSENERVEAAASIATHDEEVSPNDLNAEVDVAQSHELLERDSKHGTSRSPQGEDNKSAQDSRGSEDDEIASIAEMSTNVMPWLAYTTSNEDPKNIATTGFPSLNKVEVYTEAPIRLGESSLGYDDDPYVWLCAVILGKAQTNFSLGARVGELEDVAAARKLQHGSNRKIILQSGAQCLPLLCLCASQWFDGGKITELANELQRSIFRWTSGDLWEVAVNAMDMEELQSEVRLQGDVMPWSESIDPPTDDDESRHVQHPESSLPGYVEYGYNNTPDATDQATVVVPHTPAENFRAQERWRQKGLGTASRPLYQRKPQPRQKLSDPNIFTIKECDDSLQGTVEATRAEHLMVYFKQGRPVSTLIEGVIKLRAVGCPNDFIVGMQGSDVYGVKVNPLFLQYCSSFDTATHDARKFKVKLSSLGGQLPLLSYSCQKKVFQANKVPLKLKIATRNIWEHNEEILRSSRESSEGFTVSMEIDCASNLRYGRTIDDLQIEIDYSGSSLQMQSCSPVPSVAHIMGPKKPVFRVKNAFVYGASCKIRAVFSHETTPMLPYATFKIKAWFSTTMSNATDSKLVFESEDEYKVMKHHVTTVVCRDEWRHQCTPSLRDITVRKTWHPVE